ncbi:hypothetical protein [Metabacillus halosaccharovorans]|uniref:hypothetical protein n=1 Tax=Metabacillus halosaccharovorans TaxID=930124 RepID=UPI0015E11EF3|nr:hypothetical protein [Metabacillus halosaccharovorans]MCM3443982.1 hypothetical protein [Metabacillus halosaccharovorans]
MFPMFVGDKRVMVLSYKPTVNDLIRDDDTYKWYKVLKIDGRKVYSRRTIDPRFLGL